MICDLPVLFLIDNAVHLIERRQIRADIEINVRSPKKVGPVIIIGANLRRLVDSLEESV